MSDTPRTDAAQFPVEEWAHHGLGCEDEVVTADFARQLERELAAALSAPSVAPQKDAGDDMTARESLEALERLTALTDITASGPGLPVWEAVKQALVAIKRARPALSSGNPTPSPSLAAHAKGEDGRLLDWLESRMKPRHNDVDGWWYEIEFAIHPSYASLRSAIRAALPVAPTTDKKE